MLHRAFKSTIICALALSSFAVLATGAVISISINELNGSVIVNGTEINQVTGAARTCDTTTNPGFLTCTVALPGSDTFPFEDLLFDEPLRLSDIGLHLPA